MPERCTRRRSRPAAYVSVQPCRLADTRLGYARLDAQTLQMATRGVCGIPVNATSVALTLTVVYPQATRVPHRVAR